MAEIAGPDPIVPLYSGEYFFARTDLLRACLRLGQRFTLIMLFWLAVVWLYFVVVAMSEWSWWEFTFVAHYYGRWGAGGVLAVLLFCPWVVYLKSRRQRVIGQSVLFAFDAKGMYTKCSLFESRMLWSCFFSWKEQGHFFLLHDGTRNILLPKSAFPSEGVETLRSLLRESIPVKKRIW